MNKIQAENPGRFRPLKRGNRLGTTRDRSTVEIHFIFGVSQSQNEGKTTVR